MPHFGYVLKFVFQIIDVLSDISVAELMFINDENELWFLPNFFKLANKLSKKASKTW